MTLFTAMRTQAMKSMRKNKLWLLQLPIILACTFAYLVIDIGVDGRIENRFLREKVFTSLRRVSTVFSDVKFKLRGERPPKSDIVIVEVDSDSISQFGRWPWHRDRIAMLLNQVFASGAKVVGLDMVFSEGDARISPELATELSRRGLKNLVQEAETDPVLAATVAKYRDRLVMGWTTEGACQPLYSTVEDPCPADDPRVPDEIPPGYEKFANVEVTLPSHFNPMGTPLHTVLTFIPNLPMYGAAARYAGYFNADMDGDGVIRRTNFIYLSEKRAYPSLPLEMARVGLGLDQGKPERVEAVVDEGLRLHSLRFLNAQKSIPITPVGAAQINFRGRERTFRYVSALELMDDPSTSLAASDAGGGCKE